MKTYWVNQYSKIRGAEPVPSNEMGNAKPVFNPNQAANAQYVFGTPLQRAKSMPQREITPLYFEDQNGDGEITRADVIKARVEGYKK